MHDDLWHLEVCLDHGKELNETHSSERLLCLMTLDLGCDVWQHIECLQPHDLILVQIRVWNSDSKLFLELKHHVGTCLCLVLPKLWPLGHFSLCILTLARGSLSLGVLFSDLQVFQLWNLLSYHELWLLCLIFPLFLRQYLVLTCSHGTLSLLWLSCLLI